MFFDFKKLNLSCCRKYHDLCWWLMMVFYLIPLRKCLHMKHRIPSVCRNCIICYFIRYFWCIFIVNLCGLSFCDLQKIGPWEKWTVYKHVLEISKKCLSVILLSLFFLANFHRLRVWLMYTFCCVNIPNVTASYWTFLDYYITFFLWIFIHN